jgi:MFS family permease
MLQSLKQGSFIRGWDRNIKLFFVSNLLFQTGNGLFSVLYNLYVQALGYGPSLNGRLISAQSLATALLFIPIGLAGDRYSRRWLLFFGVLGAGLACFGRSFAETGSSLQLSALLAGLFGAAIQVLAVPFLADYSKPKDRLKLLSYHFSATLAAQVLGSTGGGVLADLLQQAGMSKAGSLQAVLAAGSAATVAACLPLLLIRERRQAAEPEITTTEASDMQGSTQPEATAGKRGDWTIMLQFAATQLLVGIGSGLVIPYLNLYFTDRFNAPLTMVGILISLGQIMTILSMLIGPKLAGRIGQVPAIILFQVLSLPFLLLTGFTQVFLVASIGYLFRQALMNAANPLHSSVLVEKVSGARRGLANSLNQTMFMMGWALMGTVQPQIISAFGIYQGYAVTFSLTGALYVTSSACFYFMFRDKRASRSSSVSLPE